MLKDIRCQRKEVSKMEKLIKAWANDKKRRDWIDNYRDWDMSYELTHYGLEFF